VGVGASLLKISTLYLDLPARMFGKFGAGGPEMSRILILSLLIGTGALVMTVLMISISVPLLGDTYQKTMFVNGVLGCYGIGSPVSYYCLKQGEKFREANIELARLHAELEQTHAKLADKIRYDHLTGLLAREYFFGEFKDRRNASKTNSLLLIDADHFKKINDQ
jgi:predicted signal transduction protein with EAL and GGDEF domain